MMFVLTTSWFLAHTILAMTKLMGAHLQDMDAGADEADMVRVHVPDERQKCRHQSGFGQGAAASGGSHQGSNQGQQGLHEGEAVPVGHLVWPHERGHRTVHEQRQQTALAAGTDGRDDRCVSRPLYQLLHVRP